MNPIESGPSAIPARRGLASHLYVQVLTAILLGAILGHFWPHAGEALKPLGTGSSSWSR